MLFKITMERQKKNMTNGIKKKPLKNAIKPENGLKIIIQMYIMKF